MISIRVPKLLLQKVEEYAEERGFIRADGANVSGTILAILREKFNCKDPDDTATIGDLNAKFLELEGKLRAELADFLKEFEQGTKQ